MKNPSTPITWFINGLHIAKCLYLYILRSVQFNSACLKNMLEKIKTKNLFSKIFKTG